MKRVYLLLLILIACETSSTVPENEVSAYTELELNKSGLVLDENLPVILTNCTACHSAKLVGQNRATREGWVEMIRWMQKSQNLWDLGENEAIILDYLEKYYGPEEQGRRAQLVIAEWYKLE